jgi:hypothetical protein
MTYAELSTRITAAEFEWWQGLAMLRQDECPHCGVEPRDLMDYEIREIKCPICREKYHKVGHIRMK